MAKIPEEKRSYPRVKASLKVDVSKNISGNSIDLSEDGVGFSAQETILSPTTSLQIHFPDMESTFMVDARLIWKRDLESGGSLYGMEFIGLNEIQKAELRKELIKRQISELLNDIKDPEIKKVVSDFFLKDMLDYISEIIKISLILPKEKECFEEIERNLEHLNTQILLKGYCLEELLTDKKIIDKIKDNFRKLIGSWVYKSVIMKRAFEKPLGYPGDYKMLDIFYDNKPISNNIGMYFDKYFLKSPYAVAIRIRKDRLKEMLLDFISQAKSGKIDILNIACGSCREIKELLPHLKTKASITFNCLDRDSEALKFSQDTLSGIAPKNVEFRFIKEDVMNIIKNERITQSCDKQNLVYSIGLIDYLPDRVLKKLIYALYQRLQKDGKLILTHKNREKTFPSLPPDWACDWKFVSRNKEEVTRLFYTCGISDFSLGISSDDFNYIYFFTISKR